MCVYVCSIQGVHTLWGSFEIKNNRLAKKMLLQYASKGLDGRPDDFNMWANKYAIVFTGLMSPVTC